MDYITFSSIEEDLGKDTLGQLYALPAQRAKLLAEAAAAVAMVNSYVGRRYAVPVTVEEAVVILADLAHALLAETAWGHAAGETIPEKVTQRASRARDMLKDISTGKMTLAGATAVAEAEESGSDGIVVSVEDPIFNRSNMGGF